jgi:hypothetical protein
MMPSEYSSVLMCVPAPVQPSSAIGSAGKGAISGRGVGAGTGAECMEEENVLYDAVMLTHRFLLHC